VHRAARLTSVVLALALLPTVALAEPDLQRQLSEREQDRQEAQSQLGEVRQQAGTARERLAAAEAELEEARAALAAREAELATARAALEEARAEVARAEEERAAAEARAEAARQVLQEVLDQLEETEAELAEKQQRLDARIRAAYKYGQVSFAEAFAGVRDISDFLNSSTYVGKVMENDRELVVAVVDLLEEVERQRAEAKEKRVLADQGAAVAAEAAEVAERAADEAERAAAQVEQATTEQQRQTAAVAERREAHQQALAELQQDAVEIADHISALDAESASIQAEIDRIAAERAAARREEERRRQEAIEAERRRQEEAAAQDPPSGGSSAPSNPAPQPPPPPPPPASGFHRPTSGTFTSGYGYRVHPITGDNRLHGGIDVANATGTPIYAARAGEVIISQYYGGFGMLVVIDHLDGMATWYAHQSSLAVSRGQWVDAGQRIGSMGSTGNSTGPHLHFEVRVNGGHRDPCNYLSCPARGGSF
jgi:murein DD-endopeptidase MepM/ murein hydrolase activator NlpD